MSTPRALEELVEHQVRRWEIERSSAAVQSRAPCIALSRLPGSGAAELAHQVAEWLDYGCFGIEIVDRIAREQHIRRELVAGLDEHVRSGLERYVIDAFRSRPFSESDYLRAVVHTVATLGERGMAVIVGRGAPFILQPDRALRVLVVAPRSVRLDRIAKEERLARPDAERVLDERDRDRQEFLRHQFGVDPDDPTLYDLVLNTGSLSIEAAATLVVEALRRRFPDRR